MTYAPPDRPFYDADSHIMELPNFLIDYADASIRDKLRPVSYEASFVTDAEVEAIVANGSKHSTDPRRGADRARRSSDRRIQGDPGSRRIRP